MVPGLGMFNESYYIFSVGNVKPIWREQYPKCWKVTLLLVSTLSLRSAHHSSFTPNNILCHGTSCIKSPGVRASLEHFLEYAQAEPSPIAR